MKSTMIRSWTLLGLLASPLIAHHQCFAVAKAPPPTTCNTGGSGNSTTPNPVRAVQLQPMGTTAFLLPNGTAVNFSADFQAMFNTAVTNTSSFQPSTPDATNPCNSYLAVNGSVSTFELNIGGASISFGYNPSGSITPVTGAIGKVAVNVGNISMDFAVSKCSGSHCTSVAATTVNQNTTGVTGSFEVDFSQVKTQADFLYNTPIAGIIRTMMTAGLTALSSSKDLSMLPWQAKVVDYSPTSNTVIFNAGAQARIGLNQAFEIFAPSDSTTAGSCNVYQLLAIAHTIMVSQVSSTAVIDQLIGTPNIKAGDIVTIHQTP